MSSKQILPYDYLSRHLRGSFLNPISPPETISFAVEISEWWAEIIERVEYLTRVTILTRPAEPL